MNNDLISREALKKAFENLASDDYNEPIWYQKTVFETIDNAPTVEAFTENDKALAYCEGYVRGSHEAYVRPQGEWGKWVVSEIRCPKCLEYYDSDCYSKEELNKCPNCGADMRKGDDKNDT